MNGIKIEQLQVSYAGQTILSVEQATFQAGKIYGVIGPSGAGKSTLLRMINLLEKPQHGTLSFFDRQLDLAQLSAVNGLAVQREMALVAQKPVMFDTTVYNNVAMGLRFRKLAKETIHRRVMKALQQVGLEERYDQRATTLSGGEAQRIALARAIVLEPRLLLLDEPTANLDPYNVAIFEEAIKQFHQQFGATIIIVTHNLPQAKRLTDSCLFLHKGNIVEWGLTPSFFSSPQTQMLADFLHGQMIY